MKNVNNMTRDDFKKIKSRKRFDEDIGEFNSLVIIPKNYNHESGYKCMEFIAVDKKGYPVCKLSGCSDVLHINGIGGYGKNWINKDAETRFILPGKGWVIDCLKISKYLRVFCSHGLSCGCDLSSFELFGVQK